MTEAEWLACDDARELIRYVRTELRAPATPVGQRRLWLFGCAGCRLGWNKLTPKSREAVEFAERLADGQEDHSGIAAMYSAVEKIANKWHETSLKRAAALDVCALLARHTADDAADAPSAMRTIMSKAAGKYYRQWLDELRQLADFLRDVFGNPFQPVPFDAAWHTDTAIRLARQMYESRVFDRMPILADALQDAGCENDFILNHCRNENQVHVRGCWVVDLVLGKA